MNSHTPSLAPKAENQPAPTTARDARLGEILATVEAVLRRRFLMLTAITAFVFIVALVVIALLPVRYDATARVRLDPSRNPMEQSQSVLNAEAIETEISVLSSLELAREVVQRLKLEQDPEFTKGADEEDLASREDRLNYVARRVMRRLNVNRDQLSYIVAISMRSKDPQKSARIANSFAETYMDVRLNARQGTSERQADFFKARLGDLAKELNAADSQLAAYRAKAGMSESGTSGTIVDQQIAPLAGQLATAQAAAATARSNANSARAQVAKGQLDSVPGVQMSNIIRDLRSQRADIVRNLGEVGPRYGPKHPERIRVNQQLAAINQQIEDEARRIVVALQAEASAAAAQVGSLQATMDSLKSQRAQNTRDSAVAERLEREAASKRAQYDKMSELSLSSTQTARGSIAQAEIIDRAQASNTPAPPKKSMLIALAFVGALAIGLFVVLILEMAQRGMRSVSEIETELGLPLLASLPLSTQASPADSIGADEATVYSEAVRNLRMSLAGIDQTNGPRIFAFTSALPDEGKSTTSLSFARMMAVNKKTVLLIDCDIRNGELRDLIKTHNVGGIVEVLRGEMPLASCIAPDVTPGLDLLTVAAPLFTSQDIFGDGAMAALLDHARTRYDAIILDLPPVLNVADARTLSMLADSIGFVIRWGKTSVSAAKAALTILQADGAPVTGIVYAMVDPTSEAARGSYYSRTYGKYYTTA